MTIANLVILSLVRMRRTTSTMFSTGPLKRDVLKHNVFMFQIFDLQVTNIKVHQHCTIIDLPSYRVQ